MFTVTILDAEPKKLPRIGITAEFTGLGTGSEYNGVWEVLAMDNQSANTRRIVVAKKFNSSITVPGGAVMRVPSIAFAGQSCALRKQLFSGFNPGDIRGQFGTHEIYPEWWGLEANHDDKAINCAIKAFRAGSPFYHHSTPEESTVSVAGDGGGNKISLAAGTYNISAPLDLSSSLSLLCGAGNGRTTVQAASSWDQSDKSWIDCTVWARPGETSSVRNHSALIWIGSVFPDSGQSFRTGVKGMELRCWEAIKTGKAVDGTGWVSGISSKGWVEENTIIEDIGVANFSGFGIGFGRRMPYTHNGTDYTPIATVNGLTVRNF